jgi:alkylhydroperoxidase family enzyme
MAYSEATFRPWLRFSGALLNQLALDPVLRELAILRVGQLTARYEWDQHVPVALAVGVTQAQIDALERGALGELEPRPRTAVEFATGVVHGTVDDATYAALRAHLDDRQVVELTLVAAHYLMMARMMTTLRIDPDPAAGPQALLFD